ncbi:Co2+/Mg2+ efflux protein ApaG [Myroides injenensis]|uniref:Co2+/Mg2+ efflux protein ApaG n=1 Tax=Myroides injenensis TaxID=1183151 RepID=UPI002270CD11|nr:Co2+/Mg2+ efflux protein ApaG [Myroides injenensis]
MITKITKGVKVSVTTKYEGSFYKNKKVCFAFSYQITIENTTDAIIQIDSRYWKIADSLTDTKIVEGDGIVGEQPILYPEDSHTYQSGCVLESPMGAMLGNYTVINLLDKKKFKVSIPCFQLIAPYSMN